MWSNYLLEMKKNNGNVLPLDKYLLKELEQEIEKLHCVFNENKY